MSENDGFELAGYVAYTAIFAIFPFLVFLTALAGFVGDAAAADGAVDQLFSFLPAAVADTLAPVVRSVLTNRQGGLLTGGILVTLWSASSGIEALRTSLTRAYGLKERRSLVLRRLQSLLFIVCAAVAFIVLSILVVAGPAILAYASAKTHLPQLAGLGILIGRYVTAGLVLFLSLWALHRWLPCELQPTRRVLPGVLLSSVALLAAASLFSIYVEYAPDLSVTYGSLGGIVLTLLFFYIAALVFIYGAEFNAAGAGATAQP